ncbi:MAG TPA: MBL fold metallo-hydrolase [Candidatus Baltobacteraceae bacterium]|nr:MBL fold metallo-hydrolase [Candidatus Baltobacteraceae bacterium]
MIVRVLGSAAGGGVPQWNCACFNCSEARTGRVPRRTQSGLAVSADGERWLLLNCSPDIAEQIEAFVPLHPRPPRGTPIGGMLFTDANVDHLGGLAVLRQRGPHSFVLRSSALVRAIAKAQPAFAPFALSPHSWLEVPLHGFCPPTAEANDVVGDALSVRAIPVAGTTPGYDGRRELPGAVVAYEIRDRASGGRLLFAPVYAELDDELREAIAAAGVAILDGTFYYDDEMIAAGLMDKSARHLGHLPLGGPDGTLGLLGPVNARIIFTHINNSNPVLNPDSQESFELRASGAEIAYDGMEFTL